MTLGWSREGPDLAIAEQDVYVEYDGVDNLEQMAQLEVDNQIHEMTEYAASSEATAIFENTGQAIHVAFTIMAEPAQQDSMLRKSLVRLLDAMPSLSPRLTAWFEQLRGTPSDTVHFDGLSSYDVRAQCAMILLAVRTRLPEPEMWALQAKYAKTDEERIEKKVRYAFSPEKAAAIRGLSHWLVQTSVFESVPLAAMDCMVAKFYAHQKNIEISYRTLAKTFGGSRMTYARAFPAVKKLLRPLEEMAIMRLEPYFAEQGIVVDQVRRAT